MHPPTDPAEAPPVAAIILAGGRASRLGGLDKTRVDLAGASSLVRVLRACPPDASRIVVGRREQPLPALPVYDGGADPLLVQEDPPFSGPVAGLGRGLREIGSARQVLVLGGDMPHLDRALLQRLLAADAATVRTLRDASGHLQFLCSAWPADLLADRLAALAAQGRSEDRAAHGLAGMSLRRLFASLPDDALTLVEADPRAVEDIDTPQDLERSRNRLITPAAPPEGHAP